MSTKSSNPPPPRSQRDTSLPPKSARKRISNLEKRLSESLEKIYKDLSPWQKVMIARHEERPHTQDYIQELFEDTVFLQGDRTFGDDPAILGGMATFRGQSICFLGHEKGRDLPLKKYHNFGMAHPEGYRKAQRIMDLAHRFHKPLICFVDTPGAFPGSQAEERGQSEAIAKCLEKSLSIQCPVISVIIGEGGSGGAIALATANALAMLEHSVYSVISPEAGSSILYRTREKKEIMAKAQKLTAQDLLSFGMIDAILPEPLGGAHHDVPLTMAQVGDFLEDALKRLSCTKDYLKDRRDKFMKMTLWPTVTAAQKKNPPPK